MKAIVQQKLKFKDGSMISYATTPSGEVRRVIDYAATDGYPAEHVDNAGKYYYLKNLAQYKEEIGSALFSEIEYIYNNTSDKFDTGLCQEICHRINKRGFFEQADVFFSVIYLAMVDLEANKMSDDWLGKKLVLDSCKAVLIDGMPYREAANLHI